METPSGTFSPREKAVIGREARESPKLLSQRFWAVGLVFVRSRLRG
jgi:hypothetical protein